MQYCCTAAQTCDVLVCMCVLAHIALRAQTIFIILNFYAFRFIFFVYGMNKKHKKWLWQTLKRRYSHYFNTNRWAQIHASLLTLNSIYKINFVRTLPTSIYLYFHENKNETTTTTATKILFASRNIRDTALYECYNFTCIRTRVRFVYYAKWETIHRGAI